MKILVENTPYSLLLYLLIFKEWKETYFILKEPNISPNIIKKLKKNSNVKTIRYKKYNNVFLDYFLHVTRTLKYFFFIMKNGLISKNEIYGSDHDEMMAIFLKNNCYLIEDGTTNYRNKSETQKLYSFKSKFKRLLKFETLNLNYIPFGFDKRIKKIYLTGLQEIPKELKRKVELINIKELWENKSETEKNEILELFDFKKELYKNKKVVLLTQPLSEDSCCQDEEEKIRIYKNILSKYDKSEVVIKIHPRETTNYKEYFKEISIDDKKYPFEILNLLNVEIKKIITISSSAAFNFKGIANIDFLGTKEYPGLERVLGKSIDSIFLNESKGEENEIF